MDLQRQAEEFRHAYGVKDCRENDLMQMRLVWEEFHEFEEAHLNLLTHAKDSSESLESLALKELADMVYVAYQYACNRDWDLNTALDRVHRSNMSKLGDDGKPIRRGDGKVLKGPHYKPPYLEDLCSPQPE